MNLSASTLYALAGLGLFVLGLHAVIAYGHLFRKIIGLNIMGSGVFLVLIAGAYRAPELPPDPVPHAMVLTGIVVSVCATGLALTLALRMHAATRRTDLPDEEG